LAANPGKTHLEFEALGSAASMTALEASGVRPKMTDDWNNYYGTHTFIRLRPGASLEQTNKTLEGIVHVEYSYRILENRDGSYRFPLQPLGGITPGPMLSNNMGKAMPAMMLWFLAALGIIIAALGLLGMATFTVESRAKEVRLRKIMGASAQDLALMLSRNFLILLGVAAAIAAPIGWFLGEQFLNIFAFRISLGVGILIPGVVMLFFVALLTVGWQTVRAARKNPVGALRSE